MSPQALSDCQAALAACSMKLPAWLLSSAHTLPGCEPWHALRAQVRGRTPFAADWYMLSSADARANSSNVAAGGAIGAFNASTAYHGLSLSPQCAPAGPALCFWQCLWAMCTRRDAALLSRLLHGREAAECGPDAPRLIDFGSVYASKTFRTNDNRTIWVGWVFETSTGCTEQCSAGSPLTQAWVRPHYPPLPACLPCGVSARRLRCPPCAALVWCKLLGRLLR